MIPLQIDKRGKAFRLSSLFLHKKAEPMPRFYIIDYYTTVRQSLCIALPLLGEK